MKYLYVDVADGATVYVPAPCRGSIAKMVAVFQADTVVANDTITAVTTAGLVVETGVPDATNKGLVFDPASSTAANQVIKITDTGAPGAKLVMIDFDDSAYVAEAASEA